MDDRLLDALHVRRHLGLGERVFGQPTRHAQGGVRLRQHRQRARIAEVGVGVTKLERAPLGVALGCPAFRIARQRQHVGPTNRFVRPAQRLRHRFPHSEHDRAQHQRFALVQDLFFAAQRALMRGPSARQHLAVHRAGRSPGVSLDGTVGQVLDRRATADGLAFDADLLATRQVRSLVVEAHHRVGQPALLFAAVSEHDADRRLRLGRCRAARRLLGDGSRGARRRLALARTQRCQHQPQRAARPTQPCEEACSLVHPAQLSQSCGG